MPLLSPLPRPFVLVALLTGANPAAAQVETKDPDQLYRVIVDGPVSEETYKLLESLTASARDLLRDGQRATDAAPPGIDDAPPVVSAEGKAPVQVDALSATELDDVGVFGLNGDMIGTIITARTALNGVVDSFVVDIPGLEFRPVLAPEQVQVLRVAGGAAGILEVHTNLTAEDLAAQALPDDAAPVVPPPTLVEKVKSDLGAGNRADRLFVPNANLLETEREALMDQLAEAGVFIQSAGAAAPIGGSTGTAESLLVTGGIEPVFAIEGPERTAEPSVENASGSAAAAAATSSPACPDPAVGWPPERLKETIAFNARVVEALHLGVPRRQKVLVVDTGLSEALARDPTFEPFLYRDIREALLNSVTMNGTEAEWRDVNGSGYYLDEFSASFDTRHERPAHVQPQSLNRAAIEGLTFMLAKKPGSRELYLPFHGNYVAGLAVGGPDLVETLGDLSRYVGVQAFRLPGRPEPDSQLSVVYEGGELDAARDYAAVTDPDVVNLSLKSTKRIEDFLGEAGPRWGSGLLVVAAGNQPVEINDGLFGFSPASLSGLARYQIVVGALDGRSGLLWDKSARSADAVDIAAPGVDVESYDADAKTVCMSGTSAAAPLVSFTAALVGAFSGGQRDLMRGRVIGSARRNPALQGLVREQRELDAVAAVDVFVDRLHVAGAAEPKRGWVLRDPAEPRIQLVSLCDPRSPHGAGFDLNRTWSIFQENGQIRAWIQGSSDAKVISSASCELSPKEAFFFDLGTLETTSIDWTKVSRVVVTPLRASIGELIEAAKAGRL